MYILCNFTANLRRHVQIFVPHRAHALCWIQPFSPRLDRLSCFCLSHQKTYYISILLRFFHSLCHSLLSHLLYLFFFFLRLTRFHAQPVKQPCFLCLRPCLWRSVGIMWGGTTSERRAAQAQRKDIFKYTAGSWGMNSKQKQRCT